MKLTDLDNAMFFAVDDVKIEPLDLTEAQMSYLGGSPDAIHVVSALPPSVTFTATLTNEQSAFFERLYFEARMPWWTKWKRRKSQKLLRRNAQ